MNSDVMNIFLYDVRHKLGHIKFLKNLFERQMIHASDSTRPQAVGLF